jgi:hypothetical protein
MAVQLCWGVRKATKFQVVHVNSADLRESQVQGILSDQLTWYEQPEICSISKPTSKVERPIIHTAEIL